MSELVCRNCGKPLSIPARGPKPQFCGDACRKAASRGRDPERAAATAAAIGANRTAEAYGQPDQISTDDVLAVWQAQPSCVSCGKGRGVDHRIGFADGGKNVLGNLQNLCPGCNAGKGNADRAARRRAAEEAPVLSTDGGLEVAATPGPSDGGRRVRSFAPRASGAAHRIGLLCPADPSHGPLIPWTGNPRWGWHCPHQDHDGWGDRPRTRPFFTTEEAETGVLATTPATQPTVPRHEREATQLALTQG